MKNSGDHGVSNDESRQNTISRLGDGMALGVVFWSALDDLLPAPLDFVLGMAAGLIIGYFIGRRPFMSMRYPSYVIRRLLLTGAAAVLGMFAYRYFLGLELGSGLQIVSSLLAIIPAVGFIYAIASAIASLDEMQREYKPKASPLLLQAPRSS